jgi:DNA ligase-1
MNRTPGANLFTNFTQLRIGAVKTTMLIALSRAFLLSRPPGAEFTLRWQKDLAVMKRESLTEVWSKAEEIVKACFARRPNYNDLIPVLLEIGVCEKLLIRCGLSLHVPLRPMLGSITRDLPEMLTRLQGSVFTCEYKYDGQRAQIHCDEKGKVSIFSRHLERMTDKYPDLVAIIPRIRGEGVSSFIMEGEVVAIDRQSGDLRAFQTLTNRARKDVAIGSIKVDVCLFAFDLMYLNGEPLLDRPFRERRELLRSLFTEVPVQFVMVKSIDATSQDSETVLEFFKNATDAKCEGIMVKILDNLTNPALRRDRKEDGDATEPKKPIIASAHLREETSKIVTEKGVEKVTRRKALLSTYEPDKRLDSWLKVKKDYSNTSDTIDLIPIAGWHGQGRKAKWWSPILLAVRNDSTGSLEAVCKCMSGFTDAFYKANKEFYAEGCPNVLGSKPSYIDYEGGYPDVWFEPQEVW